MENSFDDNIEIKLPIRIEAKAVEKLIQTKMIGENIKSEKDGEVTHYAEVLDIHLSKSEDPNFDLALDLKLRTLTTFFKNKELDLRVYLSLGFSEEEQQMFIQDYKIDGETDNWLVDKFIQTVANNVLYSKVKSKMNFKIQPLIEKQLLELNEKLRNKLEARDGIFLLGALSTLRVSNLTMDEVHFYLDILVKGSALVEITKLDAPA